MAQSVAYPLNTHGRQEAAGWPSFADCIQVCSPMRQTIAEEVRETVYSCWSEWDHEGRNHIPRCTQLYFGRSDWDEMEIECITLNALEKV